VSVLVCLAILIAVVIGITSSGENGDDKTTSPNETVSNSESGTEEQFINISVPDFRGKNIDDVKADETYKDVLSITTVYEDSDQEIGTVIAQDLPEGTMVSSINKRSITLKVSDGLKVPDLVGEDATKALKILTDKGFKYVETVVSGVAHTQEQSNKVSGIVYYPEDTENWEALPDDRRISATLRVVIYCYGEYTPPAPVPTPEPTSPPTTEEPTTESDIVDDDIIVDGGEEDTEVEFIQ
jgi:beta-lactam-binding protein with PASTA domain